MDFETFLNQSQENPVEFLSLQPLLQFEKEGGELKPGQLLSVYPPYITKESAQGVVLRAISMFDRIDFLANFAKQIAGIADGVKLKVEVLNVPDSEI